MGKTPENPQPFCDLGSGRVCLDVKTGELTFNGRQRPTNNNVFSKIVLVGRPAKDITLALIEQNGRIPSELVRTTVLGGWISVSEALKVLSPIVRLGKGGLEFNREALESNSLTINQLAHFKEYRRFLKDAFLSLGEARSRQLIHFVSLYTVFNPARFAAEPSVGESKKRKFAELGLATLQEIVYSGKTPEHLFNSDHSTIREWFSSPGKHSDVRHLYRVFYFWLILFSKLFPEKGLMINSDIKESWDFKEAERQSRFALKRASINLMLAREIIRRKDVLTQLKVSSSQQRLWVLSLLGEEGRFSSKLTAGDREEVGEFRHYALSGPRFALERVWERSLITGIPVYTRPTRLMEITNGLLEYCKGYKNRSLRQPRVDALRWFMARPDGEKTEILMALAERKIEEPLEALLRGKSYAKRKKMVSVLGPIWEMIVERLEGQTVEAVMKPQVTDSGVQKLTKGAADNLSENWSLFNKSALRAVKIVEKKLARPAGRTASLTTKEILALLFASSNKAISPEGFLDAFRYVTEKATPLYPRKVAREIEF